MSAAQGFAILLFFFCLYVVVGTFCNWNHITKSHRNTKQTQKFDRILVLILMSVVTVFLIFSLKYL